MQQVVNITSQNQISIPVKMMRSLGSARPRKALITQIGDEFLIKPIKDFWSVMGSLKSDVKLSDREIKEARATFAKQWGKAKQ